MGADGMEHQVLTPSIPAVYTWVFDFHALLGRSEDEIRLRLGNFLRHQGRVIRSREDAFLATEWHSVRPPLNVAREDLIITELTKSTPFGQKIAELCTFGQRPFYCGITMNLERRVGEHISGDTPLVSRLGPVRITDCALLWTEVESEDFSADPDFGQDDSGEELPPLLPALAAFESLMIRTSVPTLNERTDS